MTTLVPDSYTISHFTPPEDGPRQANIFLTARANAHGSFALVGRPRYFEDAVQEWMISKHPGGSDQLFSICNLATGHYLSRKVDSGLVVLSNAPCYWRLSCVDMNYAISSEGNDSGTLQVSSARTSRSSISGDDHPINLVHPRSNAESQSKSSHLWTLIPTFRLADSPKIHPLPELHPQPRLGIPTIRAPPSPTPTLVHELAGTYCIKHLSSGLAVDLYYSLSLDGTPVALEAPNDGASQVWKVTKKPTPRDLEADDGNQRQTLYWIQCVASGTYLSCSDKSAHGAESLATGNASPSDWVIEPVGSPEHPHYRLLVEGTNLALDISAGQLTDGTKLIVAPASGSLTQHFHLEPTRQAFNSILALRAPPEPPTLLDRSRATSTVSLQTSSSGTSTVGTFLSSPEPSTAFISDLASSLH
ncbi:hypothetical protein FRB90_008087 [Tulasnella sp. 427]|nr:hypothetical protein FRB90_008087 [Tulasnella sp. 427]